MIIAKTLVHKASMPIAEHAVRTFACTHGDKCVLEIHSDGSLHIDDEQRLLAKAYGIKATIVKPEDRASRLEERLERFPLTRALVSRGGYFSKLELPITEELPFFYFDSEIVRLRTTEDLASCKQPNAFSAESWSWYYGLRKPQVWIRERIPCRVNSGFYYLSQPFPFERMERVLSEGLYDPDAESSTDQELLAFLYPKMEMYHPDDFRRSRRGRYYDLKSLDAVALHFPGRMWEPQLDEIRDFIPEQTPGIVRRKPSVRLGVIEIVRMRCYRNLERAFWARIPLKVYRGIRTFHRSS